MTDMLGVRMDDGNPRPDWQPDAFTCRPRCDARTRPGRRRRFPSVPSLFATGYRWAWNQVEMLKDATAHAGCSRSPAEAAVDWRLNECDLTSPRNLARCARGIVLARLRRVVSVSRCRAARPGMDQSAAEPGTQPSVRSDRRRFEESGALLRQFFGRKRSDSSVS